LNVFEQAIDFWFAVQVTPRHERKVAALLEYKGYEQFLPVYTARRNWADRVKLVEQPLFPGYVFCRVKEAVFGLLRTTPGVIRIVGTAGKPVPVPDDEINAVYRTIQSGLDVCPFAPHLKIGRKVLVKRGPLSGIVGKLAEVKNRSRLVISVDLTMKAIAVDIDVADVTPVMN
jgi:transcription termination/antitermination protein NusG